jgi:hypothetical protein
MPAILRLSLAAFLSLALVGAATTAVARNLSINLDPNGDGFAIEGWSRRVAGTGTVFYQCQVAACGPGSTVSLARQPSAAVTGEMLRQREQQVAALLQSRQPGKILRIDIGPVRTKDDKQFRTAEVTRTITAIAGADIGISPFWTSGFASSGSGTYTLSSSADTRKLADTNYATFKLGILLMLGVQKDKN